MKSYLTSDMENVLRESLGDENRETQLDAMRNWFSQNFEDPAERTPFESAEGGYQWIWGGPFDAREELENEFSGVVPEDVIEELSKSLEDMCIEWAPTPSADDYDDYLAEDIARITGHCHVFSSAILDIESLLSSMVEHPSNNLLYRLLYVNVITALETYLSDVFIHQVLCNPR